MLETIRPVLDAAYVAALVVAGYEGARHASLGARSRLVVVLLLAGLLVPLAQGGLLIYLASRNKVLAQQVPTLRPQELATDWGANLPPQEREVRSRLAASATYAQTGTLIQHFDETGKRHTYAPSQRDLHEREAWLLRTRQLGTDMRTTLFFGIFLIASALFATTLGWFIGHRRQRQRMSSRT